MKRSPKSVNNCGISLSVFKFDAAKVTLFPDITRKSPEKLSVCLSKSKNDSSVFREERRAEPSAVALGAALLFPVPQRTSGALEFVIIICVNWFVRKHSNPTTIPNLIFSIVNIIVITFTLYTPANVFRRMFGDGLFPSFTRCVVDYMIAKPSRIRRLMHCHL